MRSIVPIFIQSSGIIILTPADVNILKERDYRSYKKVVLSGDLEIFYTGLVMLDEAERAAEERKQLVDRIASGGENEIILPGPIPEKADSVELLAGKYRLGMRRLPLWATGYHVQKTAIVLVQDTVIDCDEVDFRYLSFLTPSKGVRLIITGHTKARFGHVVFGGVSVEIRKNAQLYLEDINFSGMDTPVRQLDDASLMRNTRVSFRNTRIHYHFERFDSFTAPTFDRNDPLVFRDTLTYSQIDNYVFENDTDFSSLGEMEITRPVKFTAPSSVDRVEVVLPKLRLMQNIDFDMTILLASDAIVEEISDIRFSLGLFIGALEVNNASDITLTNTVFALMEAETPPISLRDSDVCLEGVRTSDIPVLINATGSKIAIVGDSELRGIRTLVRYYDINRKAEESIFELDSELAVHDSLVECENLYHYTGSKEGGKPSIDIRRSSVFGTGRESIQVRRRFYAEDSEFIAKTGVAIAVEKPGIAKLVQSKLFGSVVGLKAAAGGLARLVGCSVEDNESGIEVQSGTVFLDGKNTIKRNLHGVNLLPCSETCSQPSTVYDHDTVFQENESSIEKVGDTQYSKVIESTEYQDKLEKWGFVDETE